MAGQHETDILNSQQPHLFFAGSHKTSMCAHKLRDAISNMEEVATQAEVPSCDLQSCKSENNFSETVLKNSHTGACSQNRGSKPRGQDINNHKMQD